MGEVIEFNRKPKPAKEGAEVSYWICPECDCREMHLSSVDGTLYVNCAECEQEIVLAEVQRIDTGE